MGIASKKIDSKGLKVKEGVIQDATFITADPGYQVVTTPLRTKIKKICFHVLLQLTTTHHPLKKLSSLANAKPKIEKNRIKH